MKRVNSVRWRGNAGTMATDRAAHRVDAIRNHDDGTKPAFSMNCLGQFGEAPPNYVTHHSALALGARRFSRFRPTENVKGDIRP